MARVHAKAKMNIPMCVACVLFCLTLFSFYFTGGLFARYVTNNEGVDSARVIKFGDITITETGDFVTADGKNNFMIIPGVNLKKDIELDFDGSEAATYVFVEITTEFVTSDGYNFTYGNNGSGGSLLNWSVVNKTETNPEGWTYLTGADGKYVYYRALAPNTSISNADIITGGDISVPFTTKTQMASLNADIATLADKCLSINVRGLAVQANGFENVTKAWESVKNK